eukprot:TRINITY_DN9573_c0_g1_i1.p1 TRINITY_DN9573_c0_g1~~TRINITY_DN9573_c0_g1_i1.p1  ORF type:complete len:192 (+),score=28.16 TRINITY_DN9573_c0_g1_i1:186-761(+)
METTEKPHKESPPCCTVCIKRDGSLYFSDADDGSCPSDSNGDDDDDHEIFIGDCSIQLVDLETKVVSAKTERDCRICHLTLEASNPESGVAIELGCSCKDDLAAAHKQCAETWFKLKGNKTCEICGATARNVVGVNETEFMDQWSETSNAAPAPPAETRSFWHGHRFLNFLLACMVFAFVISWLLHFNVPG